MSQYYTIDKSSPLPLYYQVKQIILDQIAQGILKPGDPLPTETALCESCNVSRPTVRQAISELANEGHVRKEKNVGTFVTYPKMYSDLIDLYKVKDIEFSDMNIEHVIMRVLKMELRAATAKEAGKLQIEEGAEILFLVRQRVMGGFVAYSMETCLRYPLCKLAYQREALEAQSLYALLAQHDDTKLGRISRELDAVSATSAEAKLLDINKGDPVLRCVNICYSEKNDIPIIYDIVKYAGGKNKLTLRFNMDSTSSLHGE